MTVLSDKGRGAIRDMFWAYRFLPGVVIEEVIGLLSQEAIRLIEMGGEELERRLKGEDWKSTHIDSGAGIIVRFRSPKAMGMWMYQIFPVWTNSCEGIFTGYNWQWKFLDTGIGWKSRNQDIPDLGEKVLLRFRMKGNEKSWLYSYSIAWGLDYWRQFDSYEWEWVILDS